MSAMHHNLLRRIDCKKIGIYSAPPHPELSEHKFFMTPDAHAIFLHSNVPYNNIEFVTGGHKKQKTLGVGVRNRIDPKIESEKVMEQKDKKMNAMNLR